MGDIRNEFALSHSAAKKFSECERAWWISKVLFWSGWNRDAPRRTRLAYGLTKMQSCAALCGTAVHRVAEFFAINPNTPASELSRRAGAIMDIGRKESLSGAWSDDPKRHVNLFEDYYRLPWAQANFEEYRAKAIRCAAALADSVTGHELREGRPVKRVEAMAKLAVALPNGRTLHVYAGPDLVLGPCDFTDAYTSVDWKTGAARPEQIPQAELYLAYVRQAFDVRADRVEARLEYLESGEPALHTVTDAEIDATIAAAAEIAEAIAEKTGSWDENGGAEAAFKRCNEWGICRRCEFWHACKGTREIDEQHIQREWLDFHEAAAS